MGYSSWGLKELDTTERLTHTHTHTHTHLDFPGGSAVKTPPANADVGLTPEWKRSPRVGMAIHSCIHSCLENSMDRGTWWAIVCGVAKV